MFSWRFIVQGKTSVLGVLSSTEIVKYAVILIHLLKLQITNAIKEMCSL